MPDEQEQPPYISPDEIAFHLSLGRKQDELNAAINFWADHLMRKYGLSQNDGIAPDGRIVRSAETPSHPTSQNSPQ